MKLFSAMAAEVFLATAAILFSPPDARAETLVGSNVDSRVILAIQTNTEALTPWLPEGWSPIPFPRGPVAGANLLAVLVDCKLDRDADGKPKSPSKMRAAALVGLGRQDDEIRLFVYRVYATPDGYDPCGNTRQSEITRLTSTKGPSEAGRQRIEKWSVSPKSGGRLDIALNFTSGTHSWSPANATVFFNVNPDFSRIYHYEQLVDLVASQAIGKSLDGQLEYSNSIEELQAVFDGAETIVGILDIPVYVREIFLP